MRRALHALGDPDPPEEDEDDPLAELQAAAATVRRHRALLLQRAEVIEVCRAFGVGSRTSKRWMADGTLSPFTLPGGSGTSWRRYRREQLLQILTAPSPAPHHPHPPKPTPAP